MSESEKLTYLLIESIEQLKEKSPCARFNLAISGGNSPVKLFGLWRGKFINMIDWRRVNLFWVDERAVPASDPQSNLGMTRRELTDKVPIDSNSLFPIDGSSDLDFEAERYSTLVESLLPTADGVPIFDLIILGVGDDGHTSSIFPGQEQLLNHPRSYAVSVNPYTGEGRIAMTGKPIISAKKSLFYLTGESKSDAVQLLTKHSGDLKYPAAWLSQFMTEPFIFWDR